LLFTDTDSLCCEIRTDDIYADMGEDLEHFGTSNFEPTHPLYSNKNHRVLAKMKSETGSSAPEEFVGLKAKMYSLHVPVNPKKSQKKAKGIPKHYVHKRLRHENYQKILRNVNTISTCKFCAFRSINHVLNTALYTGRRRVHSCVWAPLHLESSSLCCWRATFRVNTMRPL